MSSSWSRSVNLPGLATAIGLLGVWELAVRSGAIRFDNVPPPSEVASATYSLATSGALAPAVGHTLLIALTGWAAACAAGVSLGVVIGLSPRVRAWCGTSVEVLRTLPAIAFIPVAILAFGFSWKTEFSIVVYVSIWPVLINTISAVQRVEERLVDVARVMRISRLRTVSKIVLPAATAYVTVGARLALSLSIIAAVLVEMAGVPTGAGYALVTAQQSLHAADALGYVGVLALVGLALNACFNALASKLLPAVRAGTAR